MKKNFLSSFQTAPFFLICGVMALVGCAHGGFQTSKGGILYKIESAGSGPKIKIGDFARVNFLVETEKDSVLQSTWKTGHPFNIPIRKAVSPYDLMDLFVLFSDKDSITIKVPSDSIFDPKKGATRPPFFKPHSYVVYSLKVEKVMDQKAYQAQMMDDQKADMAAKEKKRAAEMPALAKYLAANNLKPDSTKEGVMYIVKTQGTGPVPMPGDTAYVNYIGKLINGDVFDTNDSAAAQANKIYRPEGKLTGAYKPFHFVVGAHQIIEGWDNYFQTAKKGTKATLIIPSRLAYKDRESGPKMPAFSTLIFDVELVDVKKGKPLPKTPAFPSKGMMPMMRKPGAAVNAGAPVKK